MPKANATISRSFVMTIRRLLLMSFIAATYGNSVTKAGNWSALGTGMDNNVIAVTEYGENVVAAGDFTTADGATVNYIASWNESTWSALGSGLGGGFGTAYAMTVYNGNLIVGGKFTTAGGVTVNHVASWNGSSWSPLGSGINGEMVIALTVYDGKLIAGGYFTTAGGVTVNHIASWDGMSWSALGSGLNARVQALTVYNGRLIAGGYFSLAGGVAVGRIAAWNGTSWSALGSGLNGALSTGGLAVYGNKLVAGGHFTTAGGVSANYIAAWDDVSWSTFGTGMNTDVTAFATYNGELIAGGGFTTAGGVACNYVASWDGSSWSPLGSGMNAGCYALLVHGTKLIAGGIFTTAGGVTANHTAAWTDACGDIGFRPNPDGWQFANTKANMWFYLWTPLDPIDEICCCGSLPWARCFPTWELFVDAFGTSQTMINGYKRKSAAKKWQAIRSCFLGSCFGFATTSFLFWDSILSLATVFPGHTTLYSVPLADNSRRLINKYHLYQFGKIQKQHIQNFKESTTPTQTLWSCQAIFATAAFDDRVLIIYNNKPGGSGAHALNPYRCDQDITNPNLWHIYVYDNNYPNEESKITVDVAANDGDGNWAYSRLSDWGGGKWMFLMDPLTDYASTPILPPKMTPREEWISQRGENDMEFYFGDLDTVRFNSSFGSVGLVGDSLFGSVSGAYPVIPITGQENRPLGFSLPENGWRCQLTGVVDSTFYFTAFGRSTVFDYRPSEAGDHRRLDLEFASDSAWLVYNNAGIARGHDVTSILVYPDSEVVCSILGVQTSAGDSLGCRVTVDSGVVLGNFGDASAYTARLEILGPTGDTVFYSEGIELAANCAHYILTDWRVGQDADSLTILVDSGMDGSIDSTMSVVNAGEVYACSDANGDGIVDISDAVYLIAYIFAGGPAPNPLLSGDANCDGIVDISDVVYLIQYIFAGGPAPCAGC